MSQQTLKILYWLDNHFSACSICFSDLCNKIKYACWMPQ